MAVRRTGVLTELLARPRYEVIPLAGAEEAVLASPATRRATPSSRTTRRSSRCSPRKSSRRHRQPDLLRPAGDRGLGRSRVEARHAPPDLHRSSRPRATLEAPARIGANRRRRLAPVPAHAPRLAREYVPRRLRPRPAGRGAREESRSPTTERGWLPSLHVQRPRDDGALAPRTATTTAFAFPRRR